MRSENTTVGVAPDPLNSAHCEKQTGKTKEHRHVRCSGFTFPFFPFLRRDGPCFSLGGFLAFCSFPPFSFYSIMNKAQYAQYLKTDHWQRVRIRRIKIAEFRCEHCGGDGLLEVHHLTYARIRKEQMADLMALCSRCHRLIEDSIRESGHTRRASAKSLRRFTHKRLKKMGVPMFNSRPMRAVTGMK